MSGWWSAASLAVRSPTVEYDFTACCQKPVPDQSNQQGYFKLAAVKVVAPLDSKFVRLPRQPSRPTLAPVIMLLDELEN